MSSDDDSGVRKDGDGTCDACHRSFAYQLIHNGFNNSSYAYCASCGLTAFLDTTSARPEAQLLRNDRRIPREVIASLGPCPCGGRFDAASGPRCPHCRHELSAGAAAQWIEANVAARTLRRHRWWRWGFRATWRWQLRWDGLYAIVVEGRMVANPWASTADDR